MMMLVELMMRHLFRVVAALELACWRVLWYWVVVDAFFGEVDWRDIQS